MRSALVLNATYEPLSIVPARRAACLVLAEKAEIVHDDGTELHSARLNIPSPTVIRLRYVVKVPYQRVAALSRRAIFARDEHRCQYCGHRFPPSQLTFDHVVPVARGGHKGWDNIVTCCVTCNRRKGDRTPEEIGFRLVRKPRRPAALPSLTLSLGIQRAPESWRDYLFWDLSWDRT